MMALLQLYPSLTPLLHRTSNDGCHGQALRLPMPRPHATRASEALAHGTHLSHLVSGKRIIRTSSTGDFFSFDDVDDLAIARESSRLVLAVDQFSINPDVEDAVRALRQFHVQLVFTELVLEFRHQTSGLGVVVSRLAPSDVHFHRYSPFQEQGDPK